MSINVVEKVDDFVKVRVVLASVFDKGGLETFIPELVSINPEIKFLSTGGTFSKITEILGTSAESRLMQVSDYTGQPETQGGQVIHTVQPGEGIYAIARQYGVTPEQIIAANNLANPNLIYPGDQLIIPVGQ